MAKVTSTAAKTFGQGFSNELSYVKLTYDFAVDGGEADDSVVIGITSGKILVVHSKVHVETAFAGTNATMIIGVDGGDTDAFLDVTSGAVTSLTDDSVHFETAGQGIVLADGAEIACDIATADVTQGKLHLHLWYVNAV